LRKDYFSLLKELHVNSSSSWSETKRAGEHDSRYKAIESSTKRENWFRDYQAKYVDDTSVLSHEVDLKIDDFEQELSDVVIDCSR
jgi:hypothetical protein